MNEHPIGIFDSGYGGLTVLKEIIKKLPSYDYIYLGDNARAPYGSRSFDTVYKYTLECVHWFFNQGCPLVILACNTASAKALRTIQQHDLPKMGGGKRVLGVIRPTSEIIGSYTRTRHVGIFGTTGTVQSGSYPIEIAKFYPEIIVQQEACPMWVPLIENNELPSSGADYFIKKHTANLLKKDASIDTILLACTHYPLLINEIEKYLPQNVTLISQGEIVADSLENYLERHTDLAESISKKGLKHFFTTGDTDDFNTHATLFFGENIVSDHTTLY